MQSEENQYESVNHVEAAKLLGSPDRTRVPPDNQPSKIEHELPAPDCEYAVVNKANKKVSAWIKTCRREIAFKETHDVS